jgi:hypothetical protein
LAQSPRSTNAFASRHTAQPIHDHSHGKIGNVIGYHPGRVRNPDAALTRAGQVQRIKADAQAGDQLQAWEILDERAFGAADAVGDDGAYVAARSVGHVGQSALAEVQRIGRRAQAFQLRRQPERDEDARVHSYGHSTAPE